MLVENELKKLQIFDSSYFRDKSHFVDNDGTQNYLICTILPQMSGYIKYFDSGGKNMSFMIEDDSVFVKYNEIWKKIKKTLNLKFHGMPVYDENT